MASIEQLYQMKIEEVMTWMIKANDLRLENLKLKEENERVRKLAKGYYTLLHVIHPEHWRRAMTPFWNKQKDTLQKRAEDMGVLTIVHATPGTSSPRD